VNRATSYGSPPRKNLLGTSTGRRVPRLGINDLGVPLLCERYEPGEAGLLSKLSPDTECIPWFVVQADCLREELAPVW